MLPVVLTVNPEANAAAGSTSREVELKVTGRVRARSAEDFKGANAQLASARE
jgi:hypothetical protein